jgi:hypothetical protein
LQSICTLHVVGNGLLGPLNLHHPDHGLVMTLVLVAAVVVVKGGGMASPDESEPVGRGSGVMHHPGSTGRWWCAERRVAT